MRGPLSQFRPPILLGILSLGLVGYYVLVFRPLAKQSRGLDQPIRDTWRRIGELHRRGPSLEPVNLDRLSEGLAEVRAAVSNFSRVGRSVFQRIALAQSLRRRVEEPFQLVKFENQRQSVIEEIGNRLRAKKIKAPPAWAEGLPRFATETPVPELLWVELDFARQIMLLATELGFGSIEHLEVARQTPIVRELWDAKRPVEVRIQLQGTASMKVIRSFLASLPLVGAEVQSVGLPPSFATKPPLVVSRIKLVKASPVPSDAVEMSVTMTGFVDPFRE